MEYLNISKLTESDFDAIFTSIGGTRFSSDHSRELALNCDYRFRDSVVELKLVEEEPAEKKIKQEKISKLFDSLAKTVVIDPHVLGKYDKSKYYRIIETPIKSALKKASKQLQVSSDGNDELIKIAIIINNGLSLMMPEEFEQVAVKCAINDTSGIDILLVGGLYFYSDKMDSYAMFHLKEHYLKRESETTVNAILDGWHLFLNEFMTRQLIDGNIRRDKEPLQDVSFFVGDVLYVKPPPQMGKTSSFWPGGIRPREDSTGFDTCPPVAVVIPSFDTKTYEISKQSIFDSWHLKGNFFEYKNWLEKEMRSHINVIRPLVSIQLPAEKASTQSFHELTETALDIFQLKMKDLIDKACEFSDLHQSLDYILLSCVEIGIDKANDVAFITHELEFPGIQKTENIIEGERLKFEHALCIAAAHCIRVGANCIYYQKDEKYKWV